MKKSVMLLVCVLFVITYTNRQINDPTETVKNKGTDKINQKSDELIDGGLDAIEDGIKDIFKKKDKKKKDKTSNSTNDSGNNQFDHLSCLVPHSEPLSKYLLQDLECFKDFDNYDFQLQK